jgi:hypothetical protein
MMASSHRAVSPARGRTRSVRNIEGAIRNIAASDELAVVLSSLARSSGLCFSDACAIELSEGTETPFRVCFPTTGDFLPGAQREVFVKLR